MFPGTVVQGAAALSDRRRNRERHRWAGMEPLLNLPLGCYPELALVIQEIVVDGNAQIRSLPGPKSLTDPTSLSFVAKE